MSDSTPENKQRSQYARPDEKGCPTFDWQLTSSSVCDVVRLVAKLEVLPVIFVPGIMGSNLRQNSKQKLPVWRLDTTLGQPLGLARDLSSAKAKDRQKLLHPDLVEVDPEGAVPERIDGIGNADAIRARGWGQVGQGSYHGFLEWLEEHLNPHELNPARWPEYRQVEATIGPIPKPGAEPKLFPGIKMRLEGEPFNAEAPFSSILTDDLLRRAKFWMPVHAVGYNWLASNQKAAKDTLKPAILRIIERYNAGQFSCSQVILVTHSMGGLVVRACAQLPDMADKIAGIVHGVMPATGAAVAYRRCKVGMADESYIAGLVIGSTGQEVTAVFAQAPGALELLPSQDYRSGWLKIMQGNAPVDAWPKTNPYDDIYLCRDKWWGLVNEEWLSPKGGVPLKWGQYARNVALSKEFHANLSGKYHPNTYVYYGADPKQKSFEAVTWRMRRGLKPDDRPGPAAAHVKDFSAQQVRMDGVSPEYVGGGTEFFVSPVGMYASTYETSYWELHCEMQDGIGDGTVPQSSGAAPLKGGNAGVKQQFRLTGFDHEKSYKNSDTARRATLYAITKITGTAKSRA